MMPKREALPWTFFLPLCCHHTVPITTLCPVHNDSPISTMATTTTTITTTSSDEPETVPVKSERFPTRFGHMTLELQREFLDREVNAGRLTPEQSQEPWVRSLDAKTVTDDNKNEENETEEGTSRAPNETKDDVPPIRLFWWQIFSLTGRDPLFKLAKSFYARVFQEENLLFRESFARGGDEKNHAVRTSFPESRHQVKSTYSIFLIHTLTWFFFPFVSLVDVLCYGINRCFRGW